MRSFWKIDSIIKKKHLQTYLKMEGCILDQYGKVESLLVMTRSWWADFFKKLIALNASTTGNYEILLLSQFQAIFSSKHQSNLVSTHVVTDLVWLGCSNDRSLLQFYSSQQL